LQIQKTKPGYKLVKSLFGKYEEIPDEWMLVRVGDVTSGHKQGFYTNQVYSKTGIKLVRITDLQNPYLDYESMPLLELNKKDIQDFQVEKGDFLFARSGAIGRYGIVTKDIPCVFGSYIIRFIFDSTKILNEYLGYFYQTIFVEKQLNAIKQGSSNININAENIKSIKVKLPSIQEQQKITSILGTVDDTINKYDEIIVQTKHLKKGLMQQLLIKGIGHKKFKKVKWLFGKEIEIPEEWDVIQLKKLCQVVRGGSPRPAGDPKYFGGGVPWITVGELTKDSKMILDSVSSGLTDEGKKHSRFLKKGTVVVANSGATLGIPKILGLSGCANDGVAAFLEIKAELKPEFLYYRLFSLVQFLRNINQGMGQPNLNTDLLGNLKIMLPSKKEQEKIFSILNSLDSLFYQLESKKSNLEILKKGLMQKLLTGQLRV